MKTFTLFISLLIAPVAFAQAPTGETSGDTAPPSPGPSGSASGAQDTGGSSGNQTAGAGDDTQRKEGDRPGDKGGDKAAKVTLNKADLQVMAHYHNLNQMEVSLGKLAQNKAKRDDVKSYGAMLIEEHGDSDKQLLALAKRGNEKIPAVRPMNDIEKQDLAMSKQNMKSLKKLTGSDFDREFLRVIIADHEKELAKIDAKAGQVQNAELADHIRAQKPILQMHADRARELQKTEAQAMR